MSEWVFGLVVGAAIGYALREYLSYVRRGRARRRAGLI
jgi:multisubunit Na+/H+ antiporter MnhE subunit